MDGGDPVGRNGARSRWGRNCCRTTPSGWEWVRVVVLIVIFVVFGIGAYVTGLAIPEQARTQSVLQAEYEQLVLHAHILEDVDLPSMSANEARSYLREVVAWYDRVKGVTVPESLRPQPRSEPSAATDLPPKTPSI